MTNIWSKSAKQIEPWGSAQSLRLSAAFGAFSLAGFAALFVAPGTLIASPGSFNETGNPATLVSSASTGQAVGLLLAVTSP